MDEILISIVELTGICLGVGENILLNPGLDQYVPSLVTQGTWSRFREQAPIELPLDIVRPKVTVSFHQWLQVQEHNGPDHLHCKYNKFQVYFFDI